eukprot:c28026_g1_i1 orf=684-941(+)
MLVSHPSKGVDLPARLLTHNNTMEILKQKSVSSIHSETFKGPRILGNFCQSVTIFLCLVISITIPSVPVQIPNMHNAETVYRVEI